MDPKQGKRITADRSPRLLLPAIVSLLLGLGILGWTFLRTGDPGPDVPGTQGGKGVSAGDAKGRSSGEQETGGEPVKIEKKAFPSPYDVACSPDGKSLFVSNHTSLELAVLEANTGKVSKRIDLPGRPAGLAVSPDGARVYVACAAPDGKVAIVDTAKGALTGTVAVGHTPTALALSPNGKKLYCCNRFDDTISVIDVDVGKRLRKIAVARQPVAAVATLDGKTLLVAHRLPLGPSTADYVGAAVSAVDLSSGKSKRIDMANGSTGVRGICLSPDGTYAYVTHTLAHYQLPVTQIERGWTNTNTLSIVKVSDLSLLNTVLLDDVDLGAANPWGVACSKDGKSLFVTHAGTHELSVIDREELHERLDQVASGKKVATSSSASDVPLDLDFLKGVRRRVRLEGNGPRGLSVYGSKIFAAEYFSDSVAVVDVARDVPTVKCFKLGVATPVSSVRRGEMLFNNAERCFQYWQSCASCHPDARTDGLNWDLLHDGIGNPKNSRSLVLAYETPPVMALAVCDKAEVAVRRHFKHVQFELISEEDLKVVDEFLKSLQPVPSPALVNGKLSASAMRGKKVFEKADCLRCHSPPQYTSLEAYDLDHGVGMDAEKPFDTPTLVELWRTAPYLYDGRATTLEEVFTRHNPRDRHGVTSKLSSQELKDLVEYIRSL